MSDEAKQKLSYSSLIPSPSSLDVTAQLKQAVLTKARRFSSPPQSTTIRYGKKTKALPKFSASINSISTVQ